MKLQGVRQGREMGGTFPFLIRIFNDVMECMIVLGQRNLRLF